MGNQSQDMGSPGRQNQPGGGGSQNQPGGGSQTQHDPKPERTAQPGQEHRPDKDRSNSDPSRQGGQDRGGSRP